MSLPKTIFGREPAAVGALVQGILPLLILINVLHLTQTTVGLISAAVAALVACYVGFATQHPTLAVIVNTIQAGVALAAGFGHGISADQAALIIGVAGVVFGFFNRQNTSPKLAPQDQDGAYDVTSGMDAGGHVDLLPAGMPTRDFTPDGPIAPLAGGGSGDGLS